MFFAMCLQPMNSISQPMVNTPNNMGSTPRTVFPSGPANRVLMPLSIKIIRPLYWLVKLMPIFC